MSDNSRRSRPERNAPSDWSESDENWLADQMDQDNWPDDEPDQREPWYTWHDTCEFEVTPGRSVDFGDDCDSDYFDW